MAEALKSLDFTEVDTKIQKGEGLKDEVFAKADEILGHLRVLNEQLGTKQEGEKFEGLSERLEVLKDMQVSLDAVKAKLLEIKDNDALKPAEKEKQWLDAVYSGMDAIQAKSDAAKTNGNEVFFAELSTAITNMVKTAKDSQTLEDDIALPFSFDYSALKKRVEKTQADLLREGFPAEDVRTDIRDAVGGILSALPEEEQKQNEAFEVGASLIGDYKVVLEEQARLQQELDSQALALGIDKGDIRRQKEEEYELKLHAEHLTLVGALGQTSREDSGAHKATEIAKKACKDQRKNIKVDREKAIRVAIDKALKEAVSETGGANYQETIKGLDLTDAKLDQLVKFMRSIADVCLTTRASIKTIQEAQRNGSPQGSTDIATVSVAFMNSTILDKAIEQVEAIRPAGNEAAGLPAELVDVHQLLKDLGYEGNFNNELMALAAKYPRKEVPKRAAAAEEKAEDEGREGSASADAKGGNGVEAAPAVKPPEAEKPVEAAAKPVDAQKPAPTAAPAPKATTKKTAPKS